MPLEINLHSKVKQKIPAAFVKRVLEDASQYFEKLNSVSVSIVFVSDLEMRRLNRLYRHKDKATNVLSFQVIGDQITKADGRDLGDIIICYPEVAREMKKYKLTLQEDLARLIIHGFLHLLGYDHETVGERKKMEEKENIILLKIDNKAQSSNVKSSSKSQ